MRISSSFHTCPSVLYTPLQYNQDETGYFDFNNSIPFSSSIGSFLINGNYNSIFCTSNPNTPDDPIGDGDGSALRLKQELEQIVNQEIASILEPEKTKIINEHKVFQLLKQQPELMQNSVILMNFYNDNLTSNKKKVTFTESYLNSGETALAINEKESIVVDNNIDSTYKMFYDLYFNQTNDSLALLEDSSTLFDIANSCSFKNGATVFQARALYQKKYNYSEAFVDNCDEANSSNRKMQIDLKQDEIKAETYHIYPNPSKGEIIIQTKDFFEIQISDAQGRKIPFEKLKIEDNLYKISLDCENGFYSIVLKNYKETIIEKIQILK
jgi:hypothetical protein